MIDTTHTHRWRIGMPNGPVSMGTCACGETKQFRNSGEGEGKDVPKYIRDNMRRRRHERATGLKQ